MAYPFAPKIVYGPGPTTILFNNSMGMWTPDKITQGGGSESAAGVPETFVIRKDSLLKFALRFDEAEYATVAAWVDWCFDNGSAGYFSFFPAQTNATSYQSWLLNPKVGTEWNIRRVSGYIKVLELDIVLRTRTVNQLYDIPSLVTSL